MDKKLAALSVLLAVSAAVGWGMVVRRERSFAQGHEMTRVLVAKKDLAAGTVLKEALVEAMPVPRMYMQQDAYEASMALDLKLLDNLVLAVRIPKGNQITQSCLLVPVRKPGADEPRLQPTYTHYLQGLKYFQNGEYEKAREEWKTAKKLAPDNAEAAAGLRRIEQIMAAY